MQPAPKRIVARKRLRAGVPRASSKFGDEDYAAAEPNVKLSRAFLVVLLLHVVAVGGIFAFSALKDRQQAAGKQAHASPAATGGAKDVTTSNNLRKVKPGETLSGIASQYGLSVHDLEQANGLKAGATVAAGRELIIPERSSVKPVPLDLQKLVDTSRPAVKSASPGATEKTSDDAVRYYTVQRGDRPAAIARKLKVSESDLLKVNNIENPKRLQIGQRLMIPDRRAD